MQGYFTMYLRCRGPSLAPIICTILMWSACHWSYGYADSFSLKMVHKFSSEAKDFWSRKYGDSFRPGPVKGTRDYHKMLYKHDVARHGRKLMTYQSLYFSAGNETMDYGEQFGWLHYAVLDIGTPNTSFLVALDTGSDLLWVPCECKECAPTSSSRYGLDKKLNVYSPSASKTSKHVTCSNSLCDLGKTCKSKNEDCPYNIQYLSDNTSTSGILIEDVIYLTSGNQLGDSGPVKTPVMFGCGQVQSGGFLDGGAPDGLLGLGLGDIAVPNSLAKAGLVENSFSMCFQPDDSGRIFFGDNGTTSQQTTAFLPINGTYLVYMVALDQIAVGSATLEARGQEILVDSGTSFTYLPTEIYLAVTSKFDEQVKQTRVVYPDVPWDFCYQVSNTQDSNEIPSMSMVFHGGGNFTIYSPLIGLYDENGTIDAFCLGMLMGDVAILGQNFMTSYRLVFDRKELKLGWFPSDCYKLEEANGLEAAAPSSTLSPLKATPSSDAPNGYAPGPKHAMSPAIPGSTVQGAEQPSSGHPNPPKPFLLCTILTVFFVSHIFYPKPVLNR